MSTIDQSLESYIEKFEFSCDVKECKEIILDYVNGYITDNETCDLLTITPQLIIEMLKLPPFLYRNIYDSIIDGIEREVSVKELYDIIKNWNELKKITDNCDEFTHFVQKYIGCNQNIDELKNKVLEIIKIHGKDIKDGKEKNTLHSIIPIIFFKIMNPLPFMVLSTDLTLTMIKSNTIMINELYNIVRQWCIYVS